MTIGLHSCNGRVIDGKLARALIYFEISSCSFLNINKNISNRTLVSI